MAEGSIPVAAGESGVARGDGWWADGGGQQSRRQIRWLPRGTDLRAIHPAQAPLSPTGVRLDKEETRRPAIDRGAGKARRTMTGQNSEFCIVTIPEAGRPNIASVAFFTLDGPGEAAADGQGTNCACEYALVRLAAL